MLRWSLFYLQQHMKPDPKAHQVAPEGDCWESTDRGAAPQWSLAVIDSADCFKIESLFLCACTYEHSVEICNLLEHPAIDGYTRKTTTGLALLL